MLADWGSYFNNSNVFCSQILKFGSANEILFVSDKIFTFYENNF